MRRKWANFRNCFFWHHHHQDAPLLVVVVVVLVVVLGVALTILEENKTKTKTKIFINNFTETERLITNYEYINLISF